MVQSQADVGGSSRCSDVAVDPTPVEVAKRVVEAMIDAVICIDPAGRIAFWNAGAERMFGRQAEEALGRPFDLILAASPTNVHMRKTLQGVRRGRPLVSSQPCEMIALRPDGTFVPLEASLASLNGEGGWLAALIRDGSWRRDLQRAEAEARQLADSIIDHLPTCLFIKDRDSGRYLRINRAAERIIGRTAEEILGRTDAELFPGQGEAYEERNVQAVRSGKVEVFESDFTRDDGSAVTLRTRRLLVEGEGDTRSYLLAISEDVTNLRKYERKVEHLARFDSLTGLLNRSAFLDTLEQLFADGGSFALLSIDLDRFKAVNDQFGHLVGDSYLAETARRLRDCVGENDVIARVGGDEFAIIVTGPAPEVEARRIAMLVNQKLGLPYRIGSYSPRGGASIGMAVAPKDASNVADLRQNVDLALYRAKTEGRGTISFFDQEMDRALKRRRILERDLARAVEHGEIQLAYQPVVSTATGEVTSFEALARWKHPQFGWVSPDLFVSIAEECGLIAPLGNLLLSLGCREAAQWHAHLRVAVNLSPLQFEQPDLVAQIDRILGESGLAPDRLQVEVTEGLVLRDVDRTFEILSELRERGIQILMDDFGVGYSSLSYFTRFPFDKVKIDRSFVRQMDEPGRTSAAVAVLGAIVNLGQALGMGVVAEGVETEEQKRMLTALGCTHLQGFYFGRPQPVWSSMGRPGHAVSIRRENPDSRPGQLRKAG